MGAWGLPSLMGGWTLSNAVRPTTGPADLALAQCRVGELRCQAAVDLQFAPASAAVSNADQGESSLSWLLRFQVLCFWLDPTLNAFESRARPSSSPHGALYTVATLGVELCAVTIRQDCSLRLAACRLHHSSRQPASSSRQSSPWTRRAPTSRVASLGRPRSPRRHPSSRSPGRTRSGPRRPENPWRRPPPQAPCETRSCGPPLLETSWAPRLPRLRTRRTASHNPRSPPVLRHRRTTGCRRARSRAALHAQQDRPPTLPPQLSP